MKESRTIPFSSAAGALDGRRRADLRPRPVPPPGRPRLARALGVVPARLGAAAGVASARQRDARLVAAIIQKLPPAQREVLTLRDVDGWTSVEVCNALGLTETNQRVLLHRGRAKVRRALESYFEGSRSS